MVVASGQNRKWGNAPSLKYASVPNQRRAVVNERKGDDDRHREREENAVPVAIAIRAAQRWVSFFRAWFAKNHFCTRLIWAAREIVEDRKWTCAMLIARMAGVKWIVRRILTQSKSSRRFDTKNLMKNYTHEKPCNIEPFIITWYFIRGHTSHSTRVFMKCWTSY